MGSGMTSPAPRAVDRTRLTLFYPALYLSGSGLGLIFFPGLSLRLFLSNGNYDRTFVQVSGLFVLGLAILVIQTIRHRLTALYPAIIGVRVIFCTGYVYFYLRTGDPFFLVTLAMVGVGLLASAICFISENLPRDSHPVT